MKLPAAPLRQLVESRLEYASKTELAARIARNADVAEDVALRFLERLVARSGEGVFERTAEWVCMGLDVYPGNVWPEWGGSDADVISFPKPKKKRKTKPLRHGTESMYSGRGCRCEPCRRAASENRKRRRAEPENRAKYNDYQKRYFRALSRLAKMHPSDFKRLLHEEQTREESAS